MRFLKFAAKGAISLAIGAIVFLAIWPAPIERSLYDLGKVEVGRNITFQVRIFNLGFRPIHLSDVKLSCNCIAAKPRQATIWPFTTQVVSVNYNSKNDNGPVKEQAALIFDSDMFPIRILQIRIFAIKYYDVQDQVINLGTLVADGLPLKKEIPLRRLSHLADNVDLKMGLIESYNSFTVSVVKNGDQAILDVDFPKTAWGKFREKLSLPFVKEDGSKTGALSTTIEGVIAGQWTAEPFYLISDPNSKASSYDLSITAPAGFSRAFYVEFKPKELEKAISIDFTKFPNIKVNLLAADQSKTLDGEIKIGSRNDMNGYVVVPILIAK